MLLMHYYLKIRYIIYLIASFGLCLALLSANHAGENEIQLPDFGDPADSIISPMQEQELGTVILSQIRNTLKVVNDPELETYIQSLGTRLVSAASDAHFPFTFLIIADPAINAFATPGGIIAVNSGLIQTAENESELAGVMAHEIAHVKQRHLARAYANAGQINIATALGVLAAVIAGAYNPEVGSAALHSAIAAGAQAQLSFSRANEQEADRIGLELMANAAYDPKGMPEFFGRLQKRTQLDTNPALEFLSTHPMTLSRISDTSNRASQYRGKFQQDSMRFQYAKARLLALSYDESKLDNKIPSLTDSYTYAIALTRGGKAQQAITVLSKLNARATDTFPIELALAQAYSAAKLYPKAVSILDKLNNIYPNNESIIYHLAQNLIDMGKPSMALENIENLIHYRSPGPTLAIVMARAAAEAKRPWTTHEAMAEYYIAYGWYPDALEQFELALKNQDIDTISQARIRAKRKILKNKLDELHKQK
jgi:predicted Zn-dependent protease